MKTEIQCLLNVLKEEIGHCEDVLALLKEKRQVLIKNDVITLKKILDKEQSFLSRSRELEDMRLGIVLAIGQKEGIENAGMPEIISMVEPQAAGQLKEIRQSLSYFIERIHYENWVISKLIHKSLELVNFNMRLLAGVRETQEKNCYSAVNSGNSKTTRNVFLDQKG